MRATKLVFLYRVIFIIENTIKNEDRAPKINNSSIKNIKVEPHSIPAIIGFLKGRIK